MLSPLKLIVLGIILGLVWLIFRTEKHRKNINKAASDEAKASPAVDLQQCDKCGAWVDVACGKKNCPISS